MTAEGSGAKDDPWRLRTPPGTSEYTIHRDESLDPPALVCRVGTTTLSYGLKKRLRGRFAMYVPPLMEAFGLAELEHNPRNDRMRAI